MLKKLVLISQIFFPIALVIPVTAGILEMIIIPSILVDTLTAWGWGKWALFAPVYHLLSILTIAGGTAAVTAYLTRKNLFETHKEMVHSTFSPLTDSIEKVVTGRWTTDSHIQARSLAIGAKVGLVAGQAKQGEIDRGQVITAIEAMALPGVQKQIGDGIEVVNDMDDFVLSQRKNRLS